MIKKILTSRNTYELINNGTIRERTSSGRSSYDQWIFFYRQILKVEFEKKNSHQSKVEIQWKKKIQQKMKKKKLRERERNNFFCMGNICIECEWVTNLRRTKKKEDEGAKYYVKLNPPMMNIYRQYFCLIFHWFII